MRRILAAAKRHKIITTAGIIFLLAVSAAVAAWLVDSNGNATGKIGSLTPPTVSPAGTFTGTQMVPGSSGDLQVTINNPNSGALKITGITQNGTVSGLTGDCATATTGGTGVDVPNVSGGLNIPVPTGSTVIKFLNAIQLRTAAPSDCQGQEPIVPLTVHFSTP